MSVPLAPMDEGRRQAYLAALGIPLWSSRHDLLGAAPSAGLVFTPYADEFAPDDAAAVAEAPTNVSETLQAAAVSASPVISASPKAAADKPLSPSVAAPSKPAAALTKSAVSDNAYPRFSCRVQTLAPGFGVVIAFGDVPDLSAQEHRLLENLIMAVGGDPMADAARESFQWPLVANPKLPRDADAAREALSAFLGRRRGVSRWLVLGETLAVYVRTALQDHDVLSAPTLRELLESPAAKRRLWQTLHG